MRHIKIEFLRRALSLASVGVTAVFLAGCLDSGADTEVLNDGTGGNNGGGTGSNQAPTISGSPAGAVTVNQTWSFTPSASDPNGDSLTFSVENAPDWTTFEPPTGTLSGTPDSGDVGMFTDIRITVSDGTLSDTIGPFSVEVTQVALGSVTVSWSLPTLYNDGSSLSGHIDGVNIYYGTAQGNYPNKVAITNIGTTTHVVDNLVPDTYHFVATVVDDQGIESNVSNIGSATVQ
jgi:hypothetical protein